MNATVHQRGYLDSWIARAIALLIAIAIGAYLVLGLGDELVASFGGDVDEDYPQIAEITDESPALRACLDDRLGDVERMQSEGILTEAQYTNFRARAESMCREQNPV